MARTSQLLVVVLLCTMSGACSLMPRELNLTPFWFHRMDAEGNLLEWDAAWPIVHYEQTPEGGHDFRIRPFYRRVSDPSPELPEDASTDHQFLWPFGRVQTYPEQTHARLFPLASWREALDENGECETDWYLLFPFLWGGSSEDGEEDYFAFLPFYADIPEFLSYRRFRTILFPLWMGLEKNDHYHQLVLWPLIGWSDCAEGTHSWFRVLPFYAHDIEQGRHERRSILWPLFSWSDENLDARSGPVQSFFFWPLLGWRTGPEVYGWTALWPLFSGTAKRDHFFVLNVLWPIYRYYWNRVEDNVTAWWVWPLFSRVISDDQDSWSALWPLIWWQHYRDPEGTHDSQWLLPFFWRIAKDNEDGSKERHVKVWPLAHSTFKVDQTGKTLSSDWSLLSPLIGHKGLMYGMQEAYGFLWEIARGVQRTPDDSAVDVLGRIYTHRSRQDGTTASMPFLFNYEQDKAGERTLRLFQFLPIPLGSSPRQAEQR